MSKYVSLDKRSKKQQKEYHSKQRRTWGNLNPVTRSVPNGKAYNRKKEKERISKEFRDGFGADFFSCFFYTTNIMTTNLTGVIIRYIREISGADKSFRKGKERDMTTMNRNYCLYSESYESSLQSKSEWMFNFMRSFKDRQMREKVVLAKSRIV